MRGTRRCDPGARCSGLSERTGGRGHLKRRLASVTKSRLAVTDSAGVIHILGDALGNYAERVPPRIRVAVGTTIADRPPHRSVRALLAHTTPT